MSNDDAASRIILRACILLVNNYTWSWKKDNHPKVPKEIKTLKDQWVVVVVVSQFNGTSTPKGSYSAKTIDNDCNVNLSRYSLKTNGRMDTKY